MSMNISQLTQEPSGVPQSLMMSEKKLAENKETFLKLLVAQMQYQDPMKPMDTTEITAQYAQFAVVEQSLESNKLHAENNKMMKSLLALNLTSSGDIRIEMKGNRFQNVEGISNQLGYVIPTGIDDKTHQATITVLNDRGIPVYQKDVKTIPGKQTFVWDGSTIDGKPASSGSYSFKIDVKDADGKALKDPKDPRMNMRFETTVSGVIQGTTLDDQGNAKMTLGTEQGGGIPIPMDQLRAYQRVIKTSGEAPKLNPAIKSLPEVASEEIKENSTPIMQNL